MATVRKIGLTVLAWLVATLVAAAVLDLLVRRGGHPFLTNALATTMWFPAVYVFWKRPASR